MVVMDFRLVKQNNYLIKEKYVKVVLMIFNLEKGLILSVTAKLFNL